MASANQLFQFPQPIIYDAIKKAFKELEWKIIEESKDKINASTPITFVSWGETIEIVISSDSNYTKVKVTSNPNFQIFDWGKSEENVKTMFDTITNLLTKYALEIK
ncbi:MAG: hypothetical protein OIN84_02065 [Candidatus Methanoperedens sp.]|uniref:hypothetical protein n=1 Tax=Candidatus Methanoperedens sp. BLZ2 TaxID=2035255 RepID=UPI000BE25D3E|nr:hypothetical protein [Candidatus Methanoperedens sp. BLZ2]KAB2946263.1 MAG: hypothetical protein F9K14_07995 [Candidatus Methanoperedens sp.]MBZ0176014.1 hypothetical protein [Candidatus Methanoperedens nitroreducens]MCX9076742.1 hypothetical protein [Candidatus Methanoperedens sp.]